MSRPPVFNSSQCFSRRKKTRRGIFILELTLILPIILLTLAILYQVSIMLTSYQVMRMTAFNASRAAAEASTADELEAKVSQTIKASVENCFLGKTLSQDVSNPDIIFISDKNAWDSLDGKILYRILQYDDADSDAPKWKYVAKNSLPNGIFALEVKFQNLDNFTSYWVLPLFVGVNKKNASIVLSQVACNRKTSGTSGRNIDDAPEQNSTQDANSQISSF